MEWFGGVLFVLVSVQPLLFARQSGSVWMVKCGLVALLSGIFALTNVAALASTVPFLLKLPLFPIFAELQKGHRWKLDVPSLVAFYWAICAWTLEHVNDSIKHRIDEGVTLLMWGMVVFSVSTIVPFHRRDWSIVAFVALTVSSVCLARFVPPTDTLSTALNAYAAHSAIQLLAAAQADEEGNSFRAHVRFLLGFVPLVRWV